MGRAVSRRKQVTGKPQDERSDSWGFSDPRESRRSSRGLVGHTIAGTKGTPMPPIYLDCNATTPLDPAVLDAMLPYLQTHFGNPSFANDTFMLSWPFGEKVTSKGAVP
jgi:hypothetical protein